jgi:hypothetical protein
VAFFIGIGAKIVKVLPLIGPRKIPIEKKAIANNSEFRNTFLNTF